MAWAVRCAPHAVQLPASAPHLLGSRRLCRLFRNRRALLPQVPQDWMLVFRSTHMAGSPHLVRPASSNGARCLSAALNLSGCDPG